jgi:hypothetical protein
VRIMSVSVPVDGRTSVMSIDNIVWIRLLAGYNRCWMRLDLRCCR